MKKVVGPQAILIASAIALLGSAGIASGEGKLDVNDVSWLFPAPQVAADVADLISPADLVDSEGDPVFSDALFAEFLAFADADEFSVDDFSIHLESAMHDKATWKIAAFRVDHSAPGTTPQLRAVFGQIPQIRLILQPVTVSGDQAVVHDVAMHLVYNFVSGNEEGAIPEIPKQLPDIPAFQKIADDIVKLKKLSADNGAPTAGVPLGVHPGLKSATARAAILAELKAIFSRHLEDKKIGAIAIMGLPAGMPEPWIFSPMRRGADGKLSVERAPALSDPQAKAMMLSFISGSEKVLPKPKTSNRKPGANANGVSTAILFKPRSEAPLGAEAEDSEDASGVKLRIRDIPDWIAHPRAVHFFNSDCVSCHTETSRRIQLDLMNSPIAFKIPPGISGIDPAVLPTNDRQGEWNVRNFGWFPPLSFFGGGPNQATATMRTLNETVEVVEGMNADFVE